jgi:hypothetical protein
VTEGAMHTRGRRSTRYIDFNTINDVSVDTDEQNAV